MVQPSPYRDLPDSAYWRRAVANLRPIDVDPVTDVLFKIGPDDLVATAGSCFAQHISRTLVESGFKYLVTEPGDREQGFGIFPARFGNIYTPKQLLQLFQLAYGLRGGSDPAWKRHRDAVFVDGFRPLVAPAGFASEEELVGDRAAHLVAVRQMFERCDVFIFTLGLTEGWRSTRTGFVVPSAPGVAASPANGEVFEFVNFPVPDMADDLAALVDKMRVVNPGVRIILTVSPVPLIATYEDRHVLVSTVYSKSALRVVAEMVSKAKRGVAYFPSYEIITGHHHGYRYFEQDLRSVSNEGVHHVMSIFARHFLTGEKAPPLRETARRNASLEDGQMPEDLYGIVCDEEIIDP
jgi:hypothetical protein